MRIQYKLAIISVVIVLSSISIFNSLLKTGKLDGLLFKVPGIDRDVEYADILLTSKNHYVLRGPVTMESTAKAQLALVSLDRGLPKEAPIHLVLDTPGGDIRVGNLLVDTAKALKRPVHTISQFSASMGFYIAQALNKRYVLGSGRMMMHRVVLGGMSGQSPGEFESEYNAIIDIVREMEETMSKRIGISLAAYREKVRDEYWTFGRKAVEEGAADAVASIKCDASLDGIHNELIEYRGRMLNLVYSDCPAVSSPIAVMPF